MVWRGPSGVQGGPSDNSGKMYDGALRAVIDSFRRYANGKQHDPGVEKSPGHLSSFASSIRASLLRSAQAREESCGSGILFFCFVFRDHLFEVGKAGSHKVIKGLQRRIGEAAGKIHPFPGSSILGNTHYQSGEDVSHRPQILV